METVRNKAEKTEVPTDPVIIFYDVETTSSREVE
jgi:hypothetical protein